MRFILCVFVCFLDLALRVKTAVRKSALVMASSWLFLAMQLRTFFSVVRIEAHLRVSVIDVQMTMHLRIGR